MDAVQQISSPLAHINSSLQRTAHSGKSHSFKVFENTSAESFGISRRIESFNRLKNPNVFAEPVKHQFNAAHASMTPAQKDVVINQLKNVQSEIDTTVQKSPHLSLKAEADFKELQQTVKQITTQFEASTTEEQEKTSSSTTSKTEQVKSSNVFIRLFNLLEHIINQLENDANELYRKIEKRTQDLDKLNTLYSKLLATKGPIDWSKDEELKQLVEEARALGIEIPKGKEPYKWDEQQKKDFLDIISKTKESWNNITNMDKTRFQQLMQLSTQMMEWRSNILKALKQAGDTIIHNIKP